MNARLELNRPALILVYGFPGSGKTYLARQLSADLHAAHVQGDRIRSELFEAPRYDDQENELVEHLMLYMTEEFLSAGLSVVYDINASRLSQRRYLRDLARKNKANPVLVWLQVDPETALSRVVKRDRRTSDDRYALPLDRTTFEQLASRMQNPSSTEDYIVLSGKHTYTTQRSAIIKKLYDYGLMKPDTANSPMVKPGLVNLVPNPLAGRVDNSRRNIRIH